ncbi:hypothetical protein TSAR_002052 [Trichomalopsis sarcophagae]|uniref:Uncharacterized protein n=1 Tax=Trichomalopsis sarcophagae TaxID=543379 RepID=A0A232F2N2_9HYME|nr:hypothetical protein TSAR_002052 [Trichomalopsis sarcophagae]
MEAMKISFIFRRSQPKIIHPQLIELTGFIETLSVYRSFCHGLSSHDDEIQNDLSVDNMTAHRYLVEIDVGALPAGTPHLGREAARAVLAEAPTEAQQVPHDHGVHDDDKDERRHEAGDAVDYADDAHRLEVLVLHVAHLVAVLSLDDPGRDEGVGVAGHRQDDQREDDALGARYRAHVRPVQRILHRDEALDRERDDQPDAQAAADRGDVDDGLAPAVLVEHPPADAVVQPDEQQREEEAEVGRRQGRQVVARAAHLEVRVEEDDAGEQVAHQAQQDDERDVVLVREVQHEVERVALVAGLLLVRLDAGLEAAVARDLNGQWITKVISIYCCLLNTNFEGGLSKSGQIEYQDKNNLTLKEKLQDCYELHNVLTHPEIYNDAEIEILVNIDGMPLYKNSDQQFWPILMKIYHRDFLCKLGIVLYCKPASSQTSGTASKKGKKGKKRKRNATIAENSDVEPQPVAVNQLPLDPKYKLLSLASDGSLNTLRGLLPKTTLVEFQELDESIKEGSEQLKILSVWMAKYINSAECKTAISKVLNSGIFWLRACYERTLIVEKFTVSEETILSGTSGWLSGATD